MNNDFKAITLAALNDATVSSTTVAEDEYPAWDSGTTYASGDRAVRAHRIVISLQAVNLDHDPADTANAAWWEDGGPSNAWAMFDYDISSVTDFGGGSGDVVLTPGIIDAVYVDGAVTDTIQVVVLDAPGGSEIYNQTKTLTGSTVTEWEGEFSDPRYTRTAALFTGIPAAAGCEVTVTFAGTNVVVASLAAGRTDSLGKTESGVQSSINSFSRIITDPDFGTRTFIRRGFSRRMEGQLTVLNTKAAKVFQILSGLEATPAVYCGTDALTNDPLRMIGYCQTFNLDWRTPVLSFISFTIEGL